MGIIRSLFLFLRAFLMGRAAVAVENLALRQQLAVLKESVKRPKLRPRDRVFWTWLMRVWPHWKSALIIVKPDTVVRWHRQGFKLYWRWKSRTSRAGRPTIEPEVRALIQRMSNENPTWGAPRIQSELTLLGHDVAESTVAKYMARHRKPPSQTWRIFLDNHVHDLMGIDFFTVPTVTFRVLYVFIVLRHDRRRVVHFNVTAHPTAQWTAQQIIEAFPFDETPGYMIRDRDRHLRRLFPDTRQEHGDRRSADRTPSTLAESVLRTRDRFHSSGVSGPGHHSQRVPPEENSDFVLRLLSPLENPFVPPSELASTARGRTAVAGRSHLGSSGWRPAPSLYTCGVSGHLSPRLQRQWSACGLRATARADMISVIRSLVRLFIGPSSSPPIPRSSASTAGGSFR